MGVVHGPDDILNRRRRVEVATRDLNPGIRELVQKIVNSWSGGKSMKELKQAIGEEKARQIVKELNLSEE